MSVGSVTGSPASTGAADGWEASGAAGAGVAAAGSAAGAGVAAAAAACGWPAAAAASFGSIAFMNWTVSWRRSSIALTAMNRPEPWRLTSAASRATAAWASATACGSTGGAAEAAASTGALLSKRFAPA